MLENYDQTEEERARRLVQKWKQRQRAKMQPQPHEVRGEIDEYKREEQLLAKQRKPMAILKNNHTLLTSLTSLNSFNIPFAILLTLFTHCYTWLTILKAHATPTNSIAHVCSKVIEML